MLNKIKKFCRKNKFVYICTRVIYVPLKMLILIKPKLKCRDEAIDLLNKRDKCKLAIFYMGIPLHKNLGDLAQTKCTMDYFEKYWPEYQVLPLKSYSAYSKKFIKLLKKNIQEKDIFFFQSGYCTTDEHLDHKMHKIIVKEFENNRIVFLPQTVLIKSEREQEKTASIFAKHKRLLFIARDSVSYSYANRMFKGIKLELYPDIVTTLIGSREVVRERNGILLCLRNDYEQLYSQEDIQKLKFALKKYTEIIDVTDTTCDELQYGELVSNLSQYIEGKIQDFSKYKLVITDRYHGTIFSMIANVPVIILASNDHKVVTGADWFKGVYDEKYYLANSISDAAEAVNKFYYDNSNTKNNPYFEQNYYAKLRNQVETL